MTVDQVAKYACDKLSIPTNNKSTRAVLDGYLFAINKNKKPVLGFDSFFENVSTADRSIEKYLKGE
jgi:hypothetical protein